MGFLKYYYYTNMEFLKAPTLLIVILSLTICISAQNKGGYWPDWAQDFLPPSNIQTAYFTHVYYAFLSPNNVTFQFDVDATTASALNRFNTALHAKNPPVKTLFSIGGGGSDGKAAELLSKMASSANSRASFIRSTIQVARNHGFDGADLDWEYPQTQTDMNNFGLLLDEWRVAVNNEAASTGKPRLLLSAATRYKPEVTDSGVAVKYPVPSINKNLDWINAMCYDYHGPTWTPDATGAPAALYDPNGGDLSTSNGLQSWINAGIQIQKLVMGMPLLGYTWKLNNPSVNGIGAPAAGKGPGDDGAMRYSEVQQFNVQNNAKVVYDTQTVSYYSYAGTTWIGYDDVNSVQRKVQYAKSLNIGGYFFWTAVGDQDWKLSRLGTHSIL
ncbi:glycoside hydrolase family 18, catalytic domain-containing protein [Artemisia annua]|uniref:Glycoside hydrolase family 18, catalytic domain-containing protein n=1 Tax=Artemisia annua TaxID=35608 RepID=A0A2U1PV75_ARTAN|nr:glycoside hydrolase family 18, catalytic domain-containing protein [Artemisia annua]